jgi:hypothetical protein
MASKKLTETDYAALRDEIRAVMIEAAKARQTITYAELCRELKTAHLHYHSTLLTKLLNEIGKEEVAAGRGVLPAVVVTKQTHIPGGGYFAGMDGIDADALEALWRDDFDSVCDYWAAQDTWRNRSGAGT